MVYFEPIKTLLLSKVQTFKTRPITVSTQASFMEINFAYKNKTCFSTEGYNLVYIYYNQQPCMAKILSVHVCLPSPFNTCIVNTESLHCIRFQSNEQISKLIIQIPIQTATYNMYLMITMYLCDHRNCTVEMIIGPMKNPVNHKHHHAWYSNQIHDVFCR